MQSPSTGTGHLRGRSDVFTFHQAEFTQREDGAIVKISDTLYDTALSGEAKVKDIHGDADFAMGRWTAGVYSSRSRSPLTFAESGDDSYHYVLVNSPATLPSNGPATCDDGAFTRPTAVRTGVQGERVGPGQASGTASLVFGSEGAAFDVSISARHGNRNGHQQFQGTIRSASEWTLVDAVPGTNALVKLERSTGANHHHPNGHHRGPTRDRAVGRLAPGGQRSY